MRALVVLLALAGAALAPSVAASDGPTCAANAEGATACLSDPAGSAASILDASPILTVPYAIMMTAAPDAPRPQPSYDPETRTVALYDDADNDGARDEGEEAIGPASPPLPEMPAQLECDPATEPQACLPEGTVPEVIVVNQVPGFYVQICPEGIRPEQATVTSLGHDARCGGDLDNDGRPDTFELRSSHNPLQPGPNDPLVPSAPEGHIAALLLLAGVLP